MSANGQEIEAKFYLNDLRRLEKTLQEKGINLIHPRVHELNLRFDTSTNTLRAAGQVLRLRKDSAAYLTFKGAPQDDQPVSVRQEIEFEVSDFDSAHSFLEALGYRVVIYYEKYRTTYRLGQVLITLDELPYGNFCELEGPDARTIQSTAQALGLRWEARLTLSYLALFDQLRSKKELAARNLSFAEFQGRIFTPADLGVTPADTP